MTDARQRKPTRLILLATAVALLITYTPWPLPLERAVFGLARGLIPPGDGTSVTVVRIDRASQSRLGPWPWPRDRVAELVRRLDEAGAAAVGLIVALDGPQTPAALSSVRRAAEDGDAPERLRDWLGRADVDARLGEALAAGPSVVLAAFPGTGTGAPPTRLEAAPPAPGPAAALRRAVARPPVSASPATSGPWPVLAEKAAGVGLVVPGWRGPAHGVPLAVTVEDDGYRAGLPLLLAALARGFGPEAVGVDPARGVRLGDGDWVATDRALNVYPRPAPQAIEVVPASALWEEGDAAVSGRPVVVAPPGAVAAAGRAAGAARAVLAGDALRVPSWYHAVQRLLVVLVGLYALLLPRRLHGRVGLALGAGIAAVAFNAGVGALALRGLVLPVTLPAVLVLLAHAWLAARHAGARRIERLVDEAARLRHRLGTALHAQGRLDEAFEVLHEARGGEAAREPLYELGLDFERRRQFTRALAVYDALGGAGARFRDVAERRHRLAAMADPATASAAGQSGSGTTLVMDDERVERPWLGRYRLEREIGRGAMGRVYLASDPKIERPVAIKTLDLGAELEGEALAAAKERFFREAAAAGRLDHANIVTVHDVGEEHDVAYIAMDYVDGQGLDAHARADALLPVDEVLDAVVQVADALAYAHDHGVVHRDIKPGNILRVREAAHVQIKVTDFGVARLVDNARTRTGAVLGSPSYMSPEQISGRRLDGRSDQFSLGVTLYQLLSGELPFEDETLAGLAYRITQGRVRDIRRLRPELPPCVGRIIGKALQKDASRRYRDAAAMAEALRRCRDQAGGASRRSRR